jgi:murein DD-endopeptidase MepM/ murein hydrolase activator NlpD
MAAALLFGLACAPAALGAEAAPDVAALPPGRLIFSGPLVQGGLVHGLAPVGTLSLALDGKSVPLDAGGHFILGFDRDQGASALLTVERSGAPPLEQRLAVAPRAWKIENIDIARRPEGPTADYLRKRALETQRIEAARAVQSATDGWLQRFTLPARGRISGLFGSQRVYRGEAAAFHSGLDIAPGAGAPVVAPADGVVVLAGPPMFSLEGNLVIVDHGMGLNSAFLHLSTYRVHVGQTVKQGETIGTVGATGRATGPHLHWSVKWREARLDPQLLVGG